MPKTYTVRQLAELMIKQSDNTAAFVLARHVGKDQIKEYTKKVGMSNTDTSKNTTTPYDTNLMFNYLYSMRSTDPTTAGTLMKIMTDTAFETRLPGMLDKKVIIAHKIGTGTAQIHDAGIVFLEKRPYIISVFSKRVSDETKAEKIIARISKTVFDEFYSIVEE